MEKIINEKEIYIQDVIQEAVFKSDDKFSDVDIYNLVFDKIGVSSLEGVMRVLDLIKLNKHAKIN